MLTLPELLDRINKDFSGIWPSVVYTDARQFPESYTIASHTQRTETREVGPDNIPRQGSLITLVDGDNYIEDDEELKKDFEERFPELVAKGGENAFMAEILEEMNIDYVPAEESLVCLCAIGPNSSKPPVQLAPPKKARAFVKMTIGRYFVKRAEIKTPLKPRS